MVAFRRMAAEDMCSTRSDRSEHGKPILREICLHLKPAALLVLQLALTSIAGAQDDNIHRCIGANGEPTFSDQKCAQSGLSIAPPKADPAIVEEDPYLPSTSQPVTTQTCAISPEDLRERALAAFETSSGVGFSGLFLWDGYGYGSSMEPLKELASVLGEPLISIELDSYANVPEVVHSPRSRTIPPITSSYELVVRTMAEGERRVPFEAVRRFGMSETRGCWWLRLAR